MKKKIVFIISLIIILLPLISCGNKNTNSEIIEKYAENLVGFWHNGPYTGSAGYLDHYEFNKDGTFIFNYNQYDGEKRIIGYSGTWQIISDNLLELRITSKTIIKGGYFTKETTSETTDYTIRDGSIKEIDIIDNPEIVIYPLGEIEIGSEEEYFYPIMLEIGGKKYWKFYSTSNDIIK